MNECLLRFVNRVDAPTLNRIYEHYVTGTTVTFETIPPSDQEFRERIECISRDFPYLVCEIHGDVMGYAYAHRCFERAAYAWCVETSVYLKPEARRLGLGRRLFGALIDILNIMNYKTLYAVIVSENVDSCVFHERMGFKRFSVFRNAGWKLGRWLDVSWYELQFGNFDTPPLALRPISTIPPNVLNDIIQKYNP